MSRDLEERQSQFSHFAYKALPPRPTFAHDMTAEERQVMQAHVAYWQRLLNRDDPSRG